jgi:hypothetical protein
MPEPTVAQIIARLNEELPGFDARVSSVRDDEMFVLQVRTQFTFANQAQIDRYPLQDDPAHVEVFVDELIRQTRLAAIEKLGLQKQIDAEVAEQVASRVAQAHHEWQQKGWQAGYAAAAKDLFETARGIVNSRQID